MTPLITEFIAEREAGIVAFSVRLVKGVANVLFSQGLFLAELRGPGNVWLQTMPFSKLVDAIVAYAQPNAAAAGAAAGVAAAIRRVGGANSGAAVGAIGNVINTLGSLG